MYTPSPTQFVGEGASQGERGRAAQSAVPSHFRTFALSHFRTFALSHFSAMSITLDYNNMLAPRLGGRGIDPAKLDALADRFRAAHEDAARRRDGGELGFYALADGGETVDAIQQFAEGAGQAFSNVVVLGIGGSRAGHDGPAHGPQASPVERAGRRGARVLSAPLRPRQHRPGHVRRVPAPRGPAPHALQRRLQERRHGRDDEPVPHHPRTPARRAGRRLHPPPAADDGPGEGRAPRPGEGREHRHPPRPRQRGRTLLRPQRGRAAAGGHDRHRHPRAAGGRAGDGGALRHAGAAAATRPASSPRCSTWRTRSWTPTCT